MSETITRYVIQENVGKRWLACSLELNNFDDAVWVRDNFRINNPDIEFKIMRKETTKSVIND